MDNDLILADAQGTPAGYGDTVQYILDKLGNEALGPELSPDQSVTIDQDTTFYNFTTNLNQTGFYRVAFTLSGVSVDQRVRLSVLDPSYQSAYIIEDGDYSFVVFANAGTRVRLDEGFLSAGSIVVDNLSFRELKGTHAHQTSASLKPARGRVPVGGRRNLLNFSEDVSGGWPRSNLDYDYDGTTDADGTAAALMSPVGSPSFATLNTLLVPAFEQATMVTALFRVRFETLTTGFLVRIRNSGDNNDRFDFRLNSDYSTTAESSNGSFVFDSLNVTAAGDGFYDVVITGTAAGGVSLQAQLVADGNPDGTYYFVKAQFEVGDTQTPYQRVTSDLDVYEEGQQHIEYLRLDHTDDKVLQTFPDGLNGDLVVCGTEGSWVDRGVSVAAGGDLEIGPVDLPQTPGVLPALGDIIGWVPVNKTLSEEEWRRVVDYYKGRGAKGRLVPSGVELVANGTFDTNSDWVLTTGFSIADGRLKYDGTVPGSYAKVSQDVPVTPGSRYKISFEITSINAESSNLRVDDGRNVGIALEQLQFSKVGTHSIYVVAPSDLLRVQVQENLSDSPIEWDNVSVQELIPEEALA